ncbi:MAG: cupin domain-containing protein [Firmicutes bacterium]|nr:cupin domain-containing protein [Bacillota bacterium]MTI71301.1 cupin domain-containing protein [Bacillota bacterium]
MIVSHENEVKGVKIENQEVKNTVMKALITPNEGWDSHAMRIFELEKDGHTPRHNHPWPHINYIVEGKGTLFLEGEYHKLKAGSFAYVPSGKMHQFKNTSEDNFKFICIVPKEGHK